MLSSSKRAGCFVLTLALALSNSALAAEAETESSTAAAPALPSVQVTPPTNEQTEAARAAARKAIERSKQQRVQVDLPKQAQDKEKLRALAEQARARGLQELKQHAEARKANGEGVKGNPEPSQQPARDGLLLVALSSSLPERMVRDYMAQLDGTPEAMVVLRGFIGGAERVTPTGIWVEKARRKDPSRLEGGHYFVDVRVDPLVFRDLGIKQVPAVAYLPGVKELRHCDEETLSAAVVVYGATTVSSALREINKRGGQVPQSLIRQLEGT